MCVAFRHHLAFASCKVHASTCRCEAARYDSFPVQMLRESFKMMPEWCEEWLVRSCSTARLGDRDVECCRRQRRRLMCEVTEVAAMIFATTVNVRQAVALLISYAKYGRSITSLQILGFLVVFAAFHHEGICGLFTLCQHLPSSSI